MNVHRNRKSILALSCLAMATVAQQLNNNICFIEDAGAVPDPAATGDMANFNPSVVQQTAATSFGDNPPADPTPAPSDDPQQSATPPAADPSQPPEAPTDEPPAPPANEPPADAVYMWGGQQVTVENSPEIVSAFQEKGIDLDKVNAEFYSEGGITAETRAQLDQAFGKVSVDMYLEGARAKNDATINGMSAEDAKYNLAVTNMVAELGGQAKVDAACDWAAKNLSAAEYDHYADLINGDDAKVAKMTLELLMLKAGTVHSNEPNPAPAPSPRHLEVLGNNSNQTGGEMGLSKADYNQLFVDINPKTGKAKYFDNPTEYDRLRNMGASNGL